MGASATLVTLPCDKFTAAGVPQPPASSAYFLDCTPGFYGIIAPAGGSFASLTTAPSGTVVHIHPPSAAAFDRTLDASTMTLDKNTDGTWPGHGVPPGNPVFIEIRSSSSEIERTGYA